MYLNESDMDYSDSSDEDLSSKRKFAKSPSPSTNAEEMHWTSQSSSSTGSGSINLAIKSKGFSTKCKLFDSKKNDMEMDLSSSGYYDSSSPTKNKMQENKYSLKRKAFDSNLERPSCSKTGQKQREPLKERNQPVATKINPMKTDDSYKNLGATEIPRDDMNDAFDKLFVCGIFNTVKPSTPTAEELQTMYINNSSDDDEPPQPKKRKMLSPIAKKKIQPKLTFKKMKYARTLTHDLSSDSDF